MITTVKIVQAHARALYWKSRVEKADTHMRKNLAVLAEAGTGKHETEHGFFTVSENNSYQADIIQSQLTKNEIDLCMEKKWSNSRAKILFPGAYLAAKVSNGHKVSI